MRFRALLRDFVRGPGDLVARTPLRVRLVAAVLALVAFALALISLASVTALQTYLVGRVDAQLNSISGQVLRQVQAGSSEIDLSRIFPVTTDSAVQLPSTYVFELHDANGRVVDREPIRLTGGRLQPRLPISASALSSHAKEPYTVGSSPTGERWRVLVQPLPESTTLVIAASLADVDSAVERLVRIDLVVGVVVLVLLAMVGVALVRASLRPLVEIEQTAAGIAAGDLTRRVPDRDPGTEVGRLGRALNAMLAQIEYAFRAREASEAAAQHSATSARRSEERMRRFIADASHELRTPLTTIRGFAELYRHGAAGDRDEVDRLVRRIEDEAARMGLLVEDLLLLARLDQQRPLAREPVDLLALGADAVQAARAVHPDRPIDLVVGTTEGLTGPPVVLGDEPRLRQVLANLLDNALVHTPAGTPVEVRVRAEHGASPAAVLEVADRGPGLTEEQSDRVFERFYRADPARSRAEGGTGLGLAIVAALVATHGGTVQVDSMPGQGAVFRVRLPLADETRPEDPVPDDRLTLIGKLTVPAGPGHGTGPTGAGPAGVGPAVESGAGPAAEAAAGPVDEAGAGPVDEAGAGPVAEAGAGPEAEGGAGEPTAGAGSSPAGGSGHPAGGHS